jgi:hypothetical protein
MFCGRHTGVNRRPDPVAPVFVHYHVDVESGDERPYLLLVGTDYCDHGTATDSKGRPEGAGKQRFAVEVELLLGNSHPRRLAGRENDHRNRGAVRHVSRPSFRSRSDAPPERHACGERRFR